MPANEVVQPDITGAAAQANAMDAASPESSAPRKRLLSKPWLALCLAFVFVRLPFMFTVPMQEAPDEFAHYWVIRFMHEHLRLPSAAEVAAGGPSAVYGSLPQLGYLPHVLTSFLGPTSELALYARFGSLFMGLLLLYCSYKLAEILFKRDRVLTFAVPATIIFHPQLAFLHSYANSDSTAAALGSLILMLAARTVVDGLNLRRSGAIGALVGWLALSKYSGLAVIPAAGLMMLSAGVLHGATLPHMMTCLFACATAAGASSGWWFVRNYHEFAGDFMGTQTMYRTWALTFHRELNYSVSASRIVKELRWWRMMFFSFWGLFGYMNKYLWRPVYFVFLGYFIAATIGCLKAIVHNSRALPSKLSREEIARAIVWCGLALTIIANLAAMVWASTKNLGGPQGRYLFPSELPVVALLVLGLSRFPLPWRNILVFSFLGFNALVCLGVWFWLFTLYGFHRTPL